MGSNFTNLAIVCVAVGTYGGLAVAIMRAALRDVRRVDPHGDRDKELHRAHDRGAPDGAG